MADDAYRLLDTRKIDAAISQKETLINDYRAVNEAYDEAVEKLLQNWKGRGAEAFRKDARSVKSNITGIYDTLRTMCDMLSDCRTVFAECDSGLGSYNREQ